MFQRPQHLLTRCGRERRVFYVEEPLFDDLPAPRLEIQQCDSITVCVPHLPTGTVGDRADAAQRRLIAELIARERIHRYVLWYYTPMALGFTDHLAPEAVIYDCMDELSCFANAPALLKLREAELLERANVVFTGGQSLFEAKRDKHANVHPFPSSVDAAHFAQARRIACDPADQASLPRPRLGFFGVLDERFDRDLLAGIAAARPAWQFVMIGPVVKIDPMLLPRADNIHYLGSRQYSELPHYIAGWDVALMPFARNEATRYISPTKTPEYLAAGKPVVSTSIRDVVRPYGQRRLVRIADTVDGFVNACEAALAEKASDRLREADAFLSEMSWDRTWAQMRHYLEAAMVGGTEPAHATGLAEPTEASCSITL